MMRILATFLGLCVATLLAAAPARADITGVWATVEGKSHVKIESCGDKLCGKIIWLKEPNTPEGKPKTDENNSDEALRSRPILGLELLSGLVPEGQNEWDDGEIYNPEDGKTYSSEMTLVNPKELEVKGCVLFICKSQTWTKVE
ncbi:DUF2147 domain-containing protein [Sneathiella chungangensis]|nr:DUF2147 domain-containing protein [Sneathiella chungangensis]